LAQQLLVRLAATSECLEDLVLDQDKIAGKAAKAAEKRWGQEQAAKAKAG
jgi:lipoate-protein ligase A